MGKIIKEKKKEIIIHEKKHKPRGKIVKGEIHKNSWMSLKKKSKE